MKKTKGSGFSLPILMALLAILIIGGTLVFVTERTRTEKAQMVRANYDLLVKSEVETVVSMLQKIYDKSVKGDYTLAYAKKLGADLLRDLRYGEKQDGYFWADTSNGTNVVLYGNKDVEGKNRWDSYVGGVYHVRDIVTNGKKPGGGFTDYYFSRKDDNQILAKRGYSLYFQPFDWIVGTGYYLDDVKNGAIIWK